MTWHTKRADDDLISDAFRARPSKIDFESFALQQLINPASRSRPQVELINVYVIIKYFLEGRAMLRTVTLCIASLI